MAGWSGTERGITITSAATTDYGNIERILKLILLDTPGHVFYVDWFFEVEGPQVLDGRCRVFCALRC